MMNHSFTLGTAAPTAWSVRRN